MSGKNAKRLRVLVTASRERLLAECWMAMLARPLRERVVMAWRILWRLG